MQAFSSSESSSSVSSSPTFGKTFFKSFDLQVQPDPSYPQTHSQFHLPSKSPAVITTRLPPELWFLILRFATYPPFPNTSSTIPFHIRLANYTSELKWKASLTRVCKEWNSWGQEFLWEDVWIASGRDGRVLVGIICDGRKERELDTVTTRWSTHTEIRAVGKEKKVKFRLQPFKRLRPSSASSQLNASVSFTTTPCQPVIRPPTTPSNISSYIKKLHIETPSMDRCCPFDLMSILESCEKLQVFLDFRSVRRGLGFTGVAGGAQVVGSGWDWGRKIEIEPGPIPQRHLFPPFPSPIPSSTLDPILQALLHSTTQQKPTLKHLTFTNYKYDSDDFQGGIWFWEDTVGRALMGDDGGEDMGLAATLESLEVVMSTRGIGMGSGLDYFGQYAPLSNGPSRNFEAGLLTSLDINHSTTQPLLSFPSLHSLRIPLTSPTLLVISTWSLPSLQSLAVVSIDFAGWRRMGFKKLMDVHGGGLVRFEIVGGGESGEEEGWITEREEGIVHSTTIQRHLHLPSTSPNLKQFTCSSNASEWNWETPDWIAPHVLMPEHFGVERIGVWGLEGKVVRGGGDGMSTLGGRGRRRRTISTWTTPPWNRHSDHILSHEEDDDNQQRLLEEQPFFMLQEQFGSLLRRQAFPSLVCIRDMSWESDLIRRSVGIGCGSSTVDPITNAKTTTSTNNETVKKGFKNLKETVATRLKTFTTGSSSRPLSSSSSTVTASPPTTGATERTETQSYKIRKFWLGVLEMCDRRGVYLEDWMGRRVVA